MDLSWSADLPKWAIALVGCILSGGATAMGAIPILFTTKIAQYTQDVMLGFGAGVMLAATSFSLLVPAIENFESFGISSFGAAAAMCLGVLMGALFIRLCDENLPHEHFIKGPEGMRNSPNLRKIWLFIIAITIHNFPEGLAVGVGFGGESLEQAISLAIGIGLQNMPEGLVVALALRTENYSRLQALGIASLTGIVEPLSGMFGYWAVSLLRPLLPFGLAFAAGAMLYVISHEIIPESHRSGNGKPATIGLIFGFLLMMFLDVALG